MIQRFIQSQFMNATLAQTLTTLSSVTCYQGTGGVWDRWHFKKTKPSTFILISPQECWWFSPKTTSVRRTPSSAAECWSGRLCSAPRASCPRGSSELGSPQRTRQRCPACGRRTGGWCGPRALRTTPARQRSHTLGEENRDRSIHT